MTESNKGRVLLVDDNPLARKSMGLLLSTLGWEVDEASGLADAVRLAQANPPQLLITDYLLSEHESGLEVISKIRESVPLIPCALITGLDDDDLSSEIQRLERCYLLRKPIQLLEFQKFCTELGINP